jgi:UDPglucose--hexose-1-phosphate uridylyltransferase
VDGAVSGNRRPGGHQLRADLREPRRGNGASNPHPHGQIWATATIPNEPAREHEALVAYQRSKGACLICDYVALELDRTERVVCESDAFVALVPFWAVWPFETTIVSRRHIGGLDDLASTERNGLADILKRLTTRCDNLFKSSFPYSLGFHQRPTDGEPHNETHFHAHCYPPLRSASIRKFMVGFELLGTPQRDLTPEEAAERLRAAGETHYCDAGADGRATATDAPRDRRDRGAEIAEGTS